MSQTAGRMRSTLGALMGACFVLLLVLLKVQDSGTLSQAQALSQRLDTADRERLEAVAAEDALNILQPLAVLADGRRSQFISDVQDGAGNALVHAWALSTAAKPKRGVKEKDPKPALAAVAQAQQGVWSSAVLVDKAGRVEASWPDGKEVGADLSKDPIFKELSNPNFAPGIPSYNFVKSTVMQAPVAAPTPVPTPLKGKDGKPLAVPKAAPAKAAAPVAKTVALLVVGCGIEGVGGNFGGLLLVRADARNVMLGPDNSAFDPIVRTGAKSVGFLLRGNGDEIFHTAKDPFVENLGSISADYKAVLASTLKSPSGRVSVASYDGASGVLVWERVGAAADGAAPEAVLSAAAFIPATALKSGAAATVTPLRPFYQRPLVLILLLLALAVPLVGGWMFLPRVLAPYERTAIQAKRVEEYGPIPDLMLADEGDDEARAVNQALATLSRRGAQAEERVRELDAALRRVEEQAGRDATQSSLELSQLRDKVSSAEQAKLASDSKFEAAQKARQDIEAQLGNLKSALEAASRNTDLKVAENKNLSAQVQDLMRALEEQRKVAEKAQEGLARKEAEVVRLAAVNTLSSELKATLTVIKNYISTMLGSQGAISDAQQEFLGVVINKSARLERLINDLVELSEIGSGVKPLHLESTTPSSLVQEALVNARPQAEHKKISLEFAESGNLSAVNVDKEKIGGVLRSLLSQAIKVTSRSEKIGLLLSERENSVELRVTDPGMSLPPDRAAKVFAQFHGVDSQAGPEFIGTGLRFPILRSVVEAHGGKIWIESQVGRGKTFVVALPKAGAAPLSQPASPSPATSSAAPAALPPMPTAPAPMPSTVPPLGPPPKAVLPSVPVPVAAPAIPVLGPPPAIAMPVEAPKPAAPPPIVHKPAPMDEALAAPWKRQETKPVDLDELMDLPMPGPKAAAPIAPLPGLPPIAVPSPVAGLGLPPLGPPPGAASLPPPMAVPSPPPVVLKTDAKPSAADAADFDKVFGAPPAQAQELKGAPPKVELKTSATPNDQDMAQFAALFGGGPAPTNPPPPPPPGLGLPGAAPSAPAGLPTPPPPPPGLGAPKAPNTADFDALFGAPGPGAPPPPPPPGLGAPSFPPAGLPTPPAPPPGMGAPKPPSSADFDAIFGAAPAGSGPPPPPPPAGLPAPAALPPPPPGPPSTGSGQAPSTGSGQAPSTGSGLGGLNTLDDLSNMLGA